MTDIDVGRLASRQHGVVSRRQLVERGLGSRAIAHRIDAGRLHPVHRGVYAVGHTVLSMRGHWMAAVLAGGPGTFLSHRATAGLRHLRPPTWIEVTSRTRYRRAGVIAHCAALPDDEVEIWASIPTTTVARMVLDCAAVLPRDQLARLLDEVEYQRLTDITPLPVLLDRYPTKRGTRILRDLLQTARLGRDLTRSDRERLFRDFLTRHHLPRPAFNLTVLGYECDAVYDTQRLIVEIDSRIHDGTHRREADVERDRRLTAAGWRVIRVTYRQITRDPDDLARDLRALLRT